MAHEYVLLGRSVDDRNEYQYRLKVENIPNLATKNAEDYTIQPKELQVVKRRLTQHPALKIASARRPQREGELELEYAASLARDRRRQMLEEMNRKLDIEVSKQKYAAAVYEQEGRYIEGQDPVTELLHGQTELVRH